jgi:hypothetical protein
MLILGELEVCVGKSFLVVVAVNVIHVELFRSIDGGRKRFGVAADRKTEVLRIFGRVRVGVGQISHFCAFLVVGGLFSVGLMYIAMNVFYSRLTAKFVQ